MCNADLGRHVSSIMVISVSCAGDSISFALQVSVAPILFVSTFAFFDKTTQIILIASVLVRVGVEASFV